MSGISNLYGGYDYDTTLSALAYSTRNTKWRGGVTGWESKEDGSSSNSSQEISSGAKDYLAEVKKHGTTINSALASLAGTDEASIFDSVKAESSDDKAVTVKISDQKKAQSFIDDSGGTKTIEVSQLASAQKNTGRMLDSYEKSDVSTGKNTFAIATGGKEYYVSVNVNSTDTNRTVQEKMAAAINDQNIGVKASVVYNEKDKTSSLVLTGKETGADAEFAIRDALGGGDAVAKMGAASVSKEASNAVYTEDGVMKFSDTNEVDIGYGMTATFNKVTEEEVTVTAKPDTEAITNSIYDLVNGFNQLRETAINAGEDSGAKALQDRLDSITSAYGATLKRAGISLNTDGYMQIDKKKLTEAIENGQAESIFGKDSGFTRSLSAVTKQAESDPERYLSIQARTGKEQDKEKDYLDYLDSYMGMGSFSPFQSMQLTRLENTSMLFNMLV